MVSFASDRGSKLKLIESVLGSIEDSVIITEPWPLDEPGPQIIYVNTAFTRLTGYTAEEVIGKTPRILQGPNTDKTALKKIKTAIAAQQSIKIELVNYRKDRSKYWVEAIVDPVWDEDGKCSHLVSIQRDISDRKRTERELTQLYAAVNECTEGIAIFDPQKNYTYVNQAYASLFGYTQEELVGKPWDVLFTSKEETWFQKSIFPLVTQTGAWVGEVLGLKKDGSFILYSLSITLLENNYLVSVTHDVTERRETTRALKQKEALLTSVSKALRALIEENMGVGIHKALKELTLCLDADRVVLFENFKRTKGCWCRINFEWSPNEVSEELEPHTATQLVSFSYDEDLPGWYRKLSRGLSIDSTGDLTPAQIECFSPQGVKSLLAIPIFVDSDFWGFIAFDNTTYETHWSEQEKEMLGVIAKSIGVKLHGHYLLDQLKTSNNELEHKVAQRTIELQRSNKDLQTFAYVTSHDLQEPLRMITNYVQILERKYGSLFDDTALRYMRFIVEGSTRMKSLIDGLLQFSRVENKPHDFEETDLNQVLQLALQNLEVAIAERTAHITSDNLPTLNVDSIQLTQLFQNLIANALKFCPSERPPAIQITCEEQEDDYRISIQDNGIGIEAKYLDEIFKPFRRLHTREEYPGTGIGLAICHRIVQRHQGVLHVSSTPGQGTCFQFCIPKGLTNEGADY